LVIFPRRQAAVNPLTTQNQVAWSTGEAGTGECSRHDNDTRRTDDAAAGR
jgi:hypothetical protein